MNSSKHQSISDTMLITLICGYTENLHPNPEADASFSVGDMVRSEVGMVKVVSMNPKQDTVILNHKELGDFQFILGALDVQVKMDIKAFKGRRWMKKKEAERNAYRLVISRSDEEATIQRLKEKWDKEAAEGIFTKVARDKRKRLIHI